MPEIIPEDVDPDGPEADPDLAEIQQRELWDRAVKVEHNGPITVQDLPARVGVMRSIQLGLNTELISGRDLRRKALLLLAESDSFYVGTTAASVGDQSAAKWPPGVPLDIRHADAVYAKAAVAGTVLSLISEQWA